MTSQPAEGVRTASPSRRNLRAALVQVEALLGWPEASAADFVKRWGPAALLRLPEQELVDRALMASGLAMTSQMMGRADLSQRILAMLRSFREMTVDFLPRPAQGTVKLGRDPRAASRALDHPSVSRLHASISWDASGYRVRDEGSRNGTFINAVQLEGEYSLRDGDTMGLGDVQLLFVTTPTLFLQLESLRAMSNTRPRR